MGRNGFRECLSVAFESIISVLLVLNSSSSIDLNSCERWQFRSFIVGFEEYAFLCSNEQISLL